jgi:hypothetical protein
MKKTEKLKSAALAGIMALLVSFPQGKESLKDIAKPYLGVYTCTHATFLGEEQPYAKNMTIELKRDNTYVLHYTLNGNHVQKKGNYKYEKDTNSIRLVGQGRNLVQHSFPIKQGILEIRVQIGNALLELLFEK